MHALPKETTDVENVAADDGILVYGVVVDKKTGEPLIGASIAIWKDGKMLDGTSTNIEGGFRIMVQEKNFEIQASFVGYRTKEISSLSHKLVAMRIELEEDANTLGDVVITGFVTKNKKTFTGSATEMSWSVSYGECNTKESTEN